MITDYIGRLLERRDLTREEAALAMADIMNGRCTPAQVAAYLVALRMKGETAEEIAGSALEMRSHAVPVEFVTGDAVDLCGTGGDGKGTFNVSTTAAFVVAGAGVKVAKHGNRAASSRCGSADLLEALGVNIDLAPDRVAECIERAGIGFMFAPAHHPAMKHVAPVRRELAARTVFNVLGPLSNPAGVKRQLVGVFDPGLPALIAGTLREMGSESAVVVHGEGGYDEATTAGPAEAAVLRNGELFSLEIVPEKLGFKKARPEDLAGGSAEVNARITLDILDGKKGPAADTVILNSALALYAALKVDKIEEGIEAAAESLDTGAAKAVLERLVETTRSMGGAKS